MPTRASGIIRSMGPPDIAEAVVPSSIATIVQTLSKANATPQPAGRDAFQQLLAEVLGLSESDPNASGPFEEDAGVNHKLIQLVTSAGLTILLQDDPFAMQDELATQAINSLLVIRMVIQRCPQVLFRSQPPQDASNDAEQPLLYLWLLPRLLQLVGHRKTEKLSPSLLETHLCVLVAATRRHEGWNHTQELLSYYECCFKSVVDSIKSVLSFRSPSSNVFRLELPGLSFSAQSTLAGNQMRQMSRPFSFSCRSPTQAVSIAVHIFSILSRLLSHVHNSGTLRSLSDSPVWMLQGLSTLWENVSFWETIPRLASGVTTLQREILEALCNAIDESVVRDRNLLRPGSVSMLALRCLIDTLRSPIEKIDQYVESTVSSIILTLLDLSKSLPSLKALLKGQLYPLALAIIQNEQSRTLLRRDLEVTLISVILTLCDDDSIIDQISSAPQAISTGTLRFNDQSLQTKAEKLALFDICLQSSQESHKTDSPRKRIRFETCIKPQASNNNASVMIQQLSKYLARREVTDLAGLSEVAGDGFGQISENERYIPIKMLGLLACASSESLSTISSQRIEGAKLRAEHVDWGSYFCPYCDSHDMPKAIPKSTNAIIISELFATLENLIKLNEFQLAPQCRIWGMMSLRRLLKHTTDVNHLNLSVSPLGQWCLQTLNSSIRELRIASTRTIPCYVNFEHDEAILKANQLSVLGFLRNLSDSDDSLLQETCITAWSQVARVSTDDELNIALLKLVEYLGHSNSFLIYLAYEEIRSLAAAQNVTARRLLTPFLRSISVSVVKQYQSRPQVAALTAELFGVDISEFLVFTQSFTLPYLILFKKTEIIAKIAQSSGQSLRSLILRPDNQAAILALLLTQKTNDVEKATMGLLNYVSSEFQNVSLGEILRSEPIPITTELMKMAGDEDEDGRERIANAIRLVATHSYKVPAGYKAKDKKMDPLHAFFETHVLGIMAQISDTINDLRGRSTKMEKIRCLQGIEQMIRLVQGSVSSALPQICACLQATMEIDSLRNISIRAWSAMMLELPQEEVLPLIGQTFSILLQHWHNLHEDSKNYAQDMVLELFRRHKSELEKSPQSIPSLGPIPMLAKVDAKIAEWRGKRRVRERLKDLAERCSQENVAVVEQALTELSSFLEQNQSFIHNATMSDQPDAVIAQIIRCLLDVCVEHKDDRGRISLLSAQCLGLIGAVDPNRVEAPRPSKKVPIPLQNFATSGESIDFVSFLLEERLVKAFLAATDTKVQGYLAYGMQELLKFCQFDETLVLSRRRTGESPMLHRWRDFSETARRVLTPYLSSKYILNTATVPIALSQRHPIFSPKHTMREWLQELLFDLMAKVSEGNASLIFSICSRIIRGQDLSIPRFLLPYVTLSVIIGGTDLHREQILIELLTILGQSEDFGNQGTSEMLRACSEVVFSLIDYLSLWLQEKKRHNQSVRAQAARQAGRHYGPVEDDDLEDLAVQRVSAILNTIPPDIIGIRSYDCNSFPRALFYWEQHIRKVRQELEENEMKPLYERLQQIYTRLDEPDGIEGISANLHVFSIDQQVLEHRNAGRWTAAQSWYELKLNSNPQDTNAQVDLLTCFKESAQYENLFHTVDTMLSPPQVPSQKIIDFAVETSWVSAKWNYLDKYLELSKNHGEATFEVHFGHALSALRSGNKEGFTSAMAASRKEVIRGLSYSGTGTLGQCHQSMLQLHALSETELMNSAFHSGVFESMQLKEQFAAKLDRRLSILGASARDREYILAFRRAVFQLLKSDSVRHELAVAWLATARLARKAGKIHQAFNAILHATELGEDQAAVEHTKLLWHEGQHRKAIQSLDAAIAAGLVRGNEGPRVNDSVNTTGGKETPQDVTAAKAMLLLAKWLDTAGQSQSGEIINNYQRASKKNSKWEQGHYYLGRHYNKLFETQKALPPNRQPQAFVSGETAKLVILNYLKCLPFGIKHVFQTLPRLITLWLDFGNDALQELDSRYGTEEFCNHIQKERKRQLDQIHQKITSYLPKIPSYLFYTALSQIFSRICHPNGEVYTVMEKIIIAVTSDYPKQALWHLMATIKSTAKDRNLRGSKILGQIQTVAKRKEADEKIKSSSGTGRKDRVDIRVMINKAQRLTDQLLHLSNADLPGKPVTIKISKDFNFKHEVAPCPLVIPNQSFLTANLPSLPPPSKSHPAFSPDQPTIYAFLDDADVMSSLQKPRKITIRGSNGLHYPFLCKPKDDLRKDARLMEFTTMINRLLKKDADSVQRRLHMRTYHVTPLNEECGIIEWVNGIRPVRDILMRQYKKLNVPVNFKEAQGILNEACSNPSKYHLFTELLLPKFPPVMHMWFIETFPDPAAWFNARLSYARTYAVWSMVGNVLGLGDRHGENILLDEQCGDTVHVDFNCLFDKGLTFDKPEMVPFRLTHNMVDGLGISGYEGPFRRSCEVTTRILRVNEDTLMTVLEAFIHDPAVDMVVKKTRNNPYALKAPHTPKDVLEGIKNKIRGLFPGETVPLSVEGQVEQLIKMAVDPGNLCKMYAGWMSFF